MKREIKFRGKALYNYCEKANGEYKVPKGTFVYGSLVLDCNKKPSIDVQGYIDGFGFHTSYDVDENTVGQFTGMHDKNGVEIYEGDTVKLEYETPFGMDGGIGEIVFTNGAFELKLFGDNEGAYNITNGSNDDLLVLGNTWDVPNLVERRNEQ